MAEVLPVGLLRITVASGSRRADLAVPATVPVAELVGDLARRVGLLDPATAHRGYALVQLDGRCLAPEAGLGAQGVTDGSILAVACGVEAAPPRRYDDPAEALATAVTAERTGWAAALTHASAAAAGGTLLGLVIGRGLPRLDHAISVSLASLLVGVVLGRGLFARLALALSSPPSAEGIPDARRAYTILTALTVGAGLVLICTAPFVAALGRWGLGVAVAACLAVVVGAVRPNAGRAERLLGLLEAGLLAALVPLFVLAGGLLDRLPV